MSVLLHRSAVSLLAALLLAPTHAGASAGATPPAFPTFVPLQSKYEDFEGIAFLAPPAPQESESAPQQLRLWQRTEAANDQGADLNVSVPRRSRVLQATSDAFLTEDGKLWEWRADGQGRTVTRLLLEGIRQLAQGAGNLTDPEDLSLLLALGRDGSVWQRERQGEQMTRVMQGAEALFAVRQEFYARRQDGTFVMWGEPPMGGPRLSAAQALTLGRGIVRVVPTGLEELLALKDDGTLLEFDLGELGDSGVAAPQPQIRLKDVASVEESEQLTLIRQHSGRTFVMGNNEIGSMTGFATEFTPEQPSEYDTRSATLSGYAVYAVSPAGELWAWGADQLPWFGPKWHYPRPTRLLKGVKSVGPGELALLDNGDLLRWTPGMDAVGGPTQRAQPAQRLLQNIERVWREGQLLHAVQTDGTRWTWGYGAALDQALPSATNARTASSGKSPADLWVWNQPDLSARLGLAEGRISTYDHRITPTDMTSRVTKVSSSTGGLLLLEDSYPVRFDRLTSTVPLGRGRRDGVGPEWEPLRDLATRHATDFFLTQAGELYQQHNPAAMPISDGPLDPGPKLLLGDVRAMAVGKSHVAALAGSGQLLGYGWNEDGQLGPVQEIDEVAGTDEWRPIAPAASRVVAGDSFTAWLTPEGGAWVTGKWQPASQVMPPTQLLNNVSDISAGSQHLLLLTKDGQMYGAGSNDKGQLLNGGTTAKPVLLLKGVDAVQAEQHHSMYRQGERLYFFGAGPELGYSGDASEPVLLHDGQRWSWER
ncbi:MAG: hypothetical protein Q4C67_04995 [Deinococcus sp.]|nr:hypothetical protein [Deinococcus sp.]